MRIDFPIMDGYFHKMDMIPKSLGPVRRIGVLPLPGFAALSYSATVELFRAANTLSHRPLYEVINIGRGEVAHSSGAVEVRLQAQVGDISALDYLFVVAGGDPMAFDDRGVMAWLSRKARAGVPLGGVSGGPVILALAGLMAGRRMTVHWEHAEALADRFPHLAIERTLYVIDRDRLTCAGGTAPVDLMHALITRHHGGAFAREVSDWFMHTEVRPAMDPQVSGLAARVGSTNPAILSAVQAMETHMADPLHLDHLAQIAGLSPRQLNRLFHDRLGQPAMRYYRNLRLDKARTLLRASALSLTEIALATGFSGSSHFSRAYAERFGHPPSAARG